MRYIFVIACLFAATADAQLFGFTPQQIQFLDLRYVRTNAPASGLTTDTVFGASGNVHGLYNTLTYTEVDTAFITWLASFNASTSGVIVTADTTTITNNGSGQFSVAHYSSNTFARLAYRMNTRRSWGDFEPGHINDTDFSEAEVGAPLEFDWNDLE